MKILPTLLLVLAITLPTFSHEVRADSKLLTLSDENFTRIYRANSEGTMFVMFYSPKCGHCTRAMPEWTEFADLMDGKIIVGSIDATKNEFTRARFEINSYPTFYLIKNEKIYKYEGIRTVSEWTNFAEEGFTYVEGRGFPSLPPKDWEKAFASFKEILHQLKYLITNKPLIFFSLIGVVLFMVILMIYVTSWLAGKMSQIDEMEKEAGKLEEIANQPVNESKPPVASTDSKKVKPHAKRE